MDPGWWKLLEAAVLWATLMHKPAPLVDLAWRMAGPDGVAVIQCESGFNPAAFRREPMGGTSWGLWQLWDREHPQYRDDLLLHLVEGAAFLRWSKDRARGITPRTMPDRVYMGDVFERAVAIYNGGTRPGEYSLAWGKRVKAKRDSWAMYLWRRLR